MVSMLSVEARYITNVGDKGNQMKGDLEKDGNHVYRMLLESSGVLLMSPRHWVYSFVQFMIWKGSMQTCLL